MIILPILHRLRNVALLTPLGPAAEEEHNGLLSLDVVDAISGADIDLQFPHAVATKAMVSQVSGIDDAADPTLYGNSPGDVANPIKPVLIDIMPAGIEVLQYLHRYLRL